MANISKVEINGTVYDIKDKTSGYSTVSVNSSGTSTEEVTYITINGVEKKLAGSSISVIDNLSSTSSVDALSANQGKHLNEIKWDNDNCETWTFTLLDNSTVTKTVAVR